MAKGRYLSSYFLRFKLNSLPLLYSHHFPQPRAILLPHAVGPSRFGGHCTAPGGCNGGGRHRFSTTMSRYRENSPPPLTVSPFRWCDGHRPAPSSSTPRRHATLLGTWLLRKNSNRYVVVEPEHPREEAEIDRATPGGANPPTAQTVDPSRIVRDVDRFNRGRKGRGGNGRVEMEGWSRCSDSCVDCSVTVRKTW